MQAFWYFLLLRNIIKFEGVIRMKLLFGTWILIMFGGAIEAMQCLGHYWCFWFWLRLESVVAFMSILGTLLLPFGFWLGCEGVGKVGGGGEKVAAILPSNAKYSLRTAGRPIVTHPNAILSQLLQEKTSARAFYFLALKWVMASGRGMNGCRRRNAVIRLLQKSTEPGKSKPSNYGQQRAHRRNRSLLLPETKSLHPFSPPTQISPTNSSSTTMNSRWGDRE